MAFFTVEKDPQAKLDYGLDWSAWLGDDTITASDWVAEPAGLALSGFAHDKKKTSVYAAGGQAGSAYLLRNQVSTAAGRIDERSIKLKVKER